MAELNTPWEAMDAFSAKIRNVTDPADRLDALAGMEAAARFVVAVELERLATLMPPSDQRSADYQAGYYNAVMSLRARASELRGEG